MSAGLLLPWRGRLPVIAREAFIAPTAVVIGDVEIGPESSVWFGTVLRGDVHRIRIGARTNIQDATIVHVSGEGQGTHIGDGVTIGHAAILHDCTLEDGSFVGMRATVMDGAVVESGAWVAAGALLTPGRRVPRGEIWAGSPARLLRAMTAAEAAEIARSADRYVELAAGYLQVS